ncbi:hypothetical protein [Microbulbifer spongiae]|uniref:DUF2147 domain-containing protein n=1 Tax=Microbulbifer spongiae TaxID=2944933 RepID=A0ABY9EHS9_9GAMM|nr:hypothetical protein [Microbulbifer sp. MI-G]WKD51125.1 hypothetical protein M8T91_06820 [Microbulbifer sp. MI-G]
MKYVITLIASFLVPNIVCANAFYHGRWEAENGDSCSDITGKVILAYNENREFSFSMFCKNSGTEKECEKSGTTKDIRLSMAYGKTDEYGKLNVEKYEGFKPSGNINGAKASGLFQSSTDCKGSWEAIN